MILITSAAHRSAELPAAHHDRWWHAPERNSRSPWFNVDDTVHDLAFANGARTGRVTPGGETTVTVGIIDAPMEGWCTIAVQRAQGMGPRVLPQPAPA
ncbi:hypothetical protein [Corynebacterium sp. Marseille-P2417]|uniref:hypothetical protein n=1 Tax=Corynebacterium pacaense TaxID=1816684 RepID=UPI0009BA7631